MIKSMKISFYWKGKQITALEEQITDLNTMDLFNQRDRDILNPVYEKDLERVRNKILPFGSYIVR